MKDSDYILRKHKLHINNFFSLNNNLAKLGNRKLNNKNYLFIDLFFIKLFIYLFIHFNSIKIYLFIHYIKYKLFSLLNFN
jgi:hypothetical protein